MVAEAIDNTKAVNDEIRELLNQIMMIITENPKVTLQSISTALNMSQPAITRTIIKGTGKIMRYYVDTFKRAAD